MRIYTFVLLVSLFSTHVILATLASVPGKLKALPMAGQGAPKCFQGSPKRPKGVERRFKKSEIIPKTPKEINKLQNQ